MEKGIRHNPVITIHKFAYEGLFVGKASFASLTAGELATTIPCMSGNGKFPAFIAAAKPGLSCVIKGSSCCGSVSK